MFRFTPRHLIVLSLLCFATSALGDAWTYISDSPTPMSIHNAETINEKIFVGQGASPGNVPNGLFYEYDPQTDQWSLAIPGAPDMYARASAVYDGMIYLFGGVSHAGPLPTAHKFDPLTQSWSLLQDGLLTPRHSMGNVAAIVAGKAYVIGAGDFCTNYRNEAYDFSTQNWAQLSTQDVHQCGARLAVVNDTIYSIGGHDGAVFPGELQPISTVQIYDPLSDTWTYGQPLNIPVHSPAVAVLDGKIMVMGGLTPTEGNIAGGCWYSGTCEPTNRVFEYDPQMDLWSEREPMNEQRWAAAAAVYQGSVFVFNGERLGYLFTGEKYDPAQDSTRKPLADAGPDRSSDEGTSVVLDGSASSTQTGVLSYAWTQLTAYPGLVLDLSDPSMPVLSLPTVPANVTVTFQLVVDNGTSSSDPDTVDVTIINSNSPPVADAGDDFSIKPGRLARLDGSNTYDPDGTPLLDLAFDWSQASGSPVTLDAADPIQPEFFVPNTVGDVLFFKLRVEDQLEASQLSSGLDSMQPDTVSVTIVENAAPLADAGIDQTVDEGNTVLLSGSGSDVDGDSLTFLWEQIGGIDIGVDGQTTPSTAFDAPPVSLGGEELRLSLTVFDNDLVMPKSDSDEVVVFVRNINDPPSCDRAFPSDELLWPPDHKMSAVGISGVMDVDSEHNQVVLTITSVTQDEPVDGLGDGDSEPDAIVVPGSPADSVLLRAERSGVGNGRVYEVSFLATDGFEDCVGSVRVSVPHDRKGIAVNDGQYYDSLGL